MAPEFTLGVVCLAANAAAVAIPTIWILTR
jgi:hypothetical protein